MPRDAKTLAPLWRYVLAATAVLVAAAARMALDPIIGERQPYLTFYLAVTLVAAIAGTGPGLVAVAGGLLADLLLVPRTPAHLDPSGWSIATASFTFVSAVTLALFEISRAARVREAEHGVRLGALARASMVLASAPSLEETLAAVTRQARRLVGAHHAEASLLAEPDDAPVTRAVDSSDAYAAMRAGERPDRPGPAVTVPVLGHDRRTAGVLRLSHPYAGRFTSDDYAVLVQLAQHASVALENARAEDAARASETRYRTLVEATHAIVWRADADGTIVDAPGWASITRPAADRTGPLGWLETVHPDDRQTTADVWAAARREQRPALAEFRLRTDAGVYRWVSMRGIPMRDAEGGVREWIGTLTDVTAAKRVEAQRAAVLRESKRARAQAAAAARRLRRVQRIVDIMLGDLSLDHLLGKLLARVVTMLNATTAVILLCDRDTLRVRASVGIDERATAAMRVPRGEGFAGAVARERRPLVWDADRIRQHDIPYLRDTDTYSLLGVPLRIDDALLGVLHVGSGLARQFDDDDVELLRLAAERIAVGIELAARRDAERHARATIEAASNAKDELLAMLGHELRNPLSAVRNAITVARLDTAHAGDALEIARRQADQLAHLVDDLLDVARLTRGAITLRRERVPINDVVQRAVDGVHELLTERAHHLSVRIPDEPIVVEGDAARLVQVVSNLLDNAARYTEPGGHVEVSASRRDDRVFIRVRDDGAGIPRELAGRVFDVFAQGDRALDRASGGLGIGLTVVKRIVEQHGGTVSMRSEGAGSGSEFEVALPGAEENAAAAAESRPAAAPAPSRLLLVEDNLEAADAFQMLLHHLGHEVEVVHDGQAALEAVRERMPDLAIIDIGLPGMSGYEVARKIRATRRAPQPMLVALTGYGRAEDRAHALASGFDQHLVKPVELDVLQNVLRSVENGPGHGAAGGTQALDMPPVEAVTTAHQLRPRPKRGAAS
jgi:PAS domain S-box-containing protein